MNFVGFISRESITSLPRYPFTYCVVTHLASIRAREGIYVLGGQRERERVWMEEVGDEERMLL